MAKRHLGSATRPRYDDLADDQELDELEVRAFSASGESAINPAAIVAAVLRNRWPVLAIVVLALIVGLVSVLLANPVYQATASIQIDQQIAKVLGTEDQDEFRVGGNEDRFLQTQVDVLQSRGLAEKVVESQKLASDDVYLTSIGIEPDTLKADQRRRLSESLIGTVQNSVAVNLPRSSRVARISVQSGNPAIAAKLANAYVDAFITSNLLNRFDQSSYSRKFLQDQLEQTRLKLEDSETAMVQFARDAGLIEIAAQGEDGSGSQSLVTSDLVQINQALAQARTARIAAEQQWAQAQAMPLTSMSEVISNSSVQALSQQLAQARVDYSELRQRLKEDHPTVRQKASVVAALERELNAQAQKIRRAIQERYDVARRQEASLAQNVDALKNDTLAERDRSIRYNILRRDVDTNRELYDALLQRFKEVSAEAGVTTNNVTVVDRAQPPSVPISPRPLRSMTMAFLLGLGAAAAFVYAREKFADAVRTPEDVEARVGLPLLGVTPMLASGTSPITEIADPKTRFSESIHAMRASLELATTHGVPSTLALTSARPAEGKSTLAYSLAYEFAKIGKNVILVDADLRAPSQHRLFRKANDVGLSQVLAHQVDLSAAIQQTPVDGLKLITSGPPPPDPTMLLGSERLEEVLAALSAQFDLVLLDCPPVLGLADALQIGTCTEGCLMVIEANDTRFGNLRTALNRLHDSRVHLFGAVLSKFDARQFGYGEYYGYYYSHYGDPRAEPS